MAFPTGWERKAELVIPPSLVPALCSNFPVLVSKASLPSGIFDADGTAPAQNGGGDLRFTSDAAGTARLDCDVVNFVTDNDPANGSCEVWVKVPTVSATVPTKIYIWWSPPTTESQPAVGDTFGRNAVWVDFAAVYHLNDTGAQADATGGGIDLTEYGSATAVAGQVGDALDFSGSDDYRNLSNAALADVPGTISAWVWPDNTSAERQIAGVSSSTETNPLYRLLMFSGGKPGGQFRATTLATIQANSALSTSAWTHLALVIPDGSFGSIYVNGADDTNVTGSHASGAIAVDYTTVGSLYRIAGLAQRWQGLLDEVRFYAGTRSADWIATEYNNQNNPGAFLVGGPPQVVGGLTPLDFMRGANRGVMTGVARGL